MRGDILPWLGLNQTRSVERRFPLASSQTFWSGEPLVLVAGVLQLCASDPPQITGLSAESVAAPPAGSLVAMFQHPGRDWKAAVFARDGLGTIVVPTLADLGSFVGFILAGGRWIADAGAVNDHGQVIDVLDAVGFSLVGNSNLVGQQVVVHV